jgi:hypothetical protein
MTQTAPYPDGQFLEQHQAAAFVLDSGHETEFAWSALDPKDTLY